MWGVVFNSNYGPFEGGSWWRQAQEGAQEYAQTASVECPLLQWLLPRIAEEMKATDQLHQPGFAQQVLDTVVSQRGLPIKGPDLALCKPLDVMDALLCIMAQ
eukprot:8616022-Lingulodinium_polyedra.AAC.1